MPVDAAAPHQRYKDDDDDDDESEDKDEDESAGKDDDEDEDEDEYNLPPMMPPHAASAGIRRGAPGLWRRGRPRPW